MLKCRYLESTIKRSLERCEKSIDSTNSPFAQAFHSVSVNSGDIPCSFDPTVRLRSGSGLLDCLQYIGLFLASITVAFSFIFTLSIRVNTFANSDRFPLGRPTGPPGTNLGSVSSSGGSPMKSRKHGSALPGEGVSRESSLLAAEVLFGTYTMNIGNWITCFDIHAIYQRIRDRDAD